MSSISNHNRPQFFETHQYLEPGLGAPQTPLNMSSQRFCLRWNNHQSNLLSVFDQLLHDESFVDVTLAVEGQLLRAHKMVLSACSPYFQALFVNHPDKHPIVILKDVPYADMRCLLDFMYRGEVSVDQDRLTAFLRVAESLRIKGLTEVNEEKCDTITSSLTQQNLPHLQRLHQNRRFGHGLNMLGNALLQPKRKRVQGSPEMLEVKMGMDNFAENNSDCSSGKADGGKDDDMVVKVKEEHEPVAGTSKEHEFNNSKTADDFHSSDEYMCDYQENNQNHTNLPDAITVELITPIKQQESVIISTEVARNMLHESMEIADDSSNMEPTAGVHFLTDEDKSGLELENGDNYEKKKNELLEYLTRHDGSVVCKLCGEVLASRTHWYRHKYKLHVNNLVNPAPLFKCTHCNVFFKSRKGYMGHISSRHSESMDQHEELNISIKEEIVETSHDLSVVSNKVVPSVVAGTTTSAAGTSKKPCAGVAAGSTGGGTASKSADWEEQRVKEEKLVADIIDRVRKECEAQGAAVSRRGYSRRSTVMNSCN